jgi:hypothetical protein
MNVYVYSGIYYQMEVLSKKWRTSYKVKGRNKYDDSDYDEASFDFDAYEISDDDEVSMMYV